MNNYWHTNYKADQPGVTVFCHSIFPHDAFDAAANARNALAVMEPPLVAAPGTTIAAPLATGNDNIVIEAAQPSPLGEGLEVDLVNLADSEQSATLTLGAACPAVFLMVNGGDLMRVEGPIKFGRYDMVRLVCK